MSVARTCRTRASCSSVSVFLEVGPLSFPLLLRLVFPGFALSARHHPYWARLLPNRLIRPPAAVPTTWTQGFTSAISPPPERQPPDRHTAADISHQRNRTRVTPTLPAQPAGRGTLPLRASWAGLLHPRSVRAGVAG